MDGWHPQTLRCLCHNADCCPAYEAWCADQQAQEDWDALPQTMRDALTAEVEAFDRKRAETVNDDVPF